MQALIALVTFFAAKHDDAQDRGATMVEYALLVAFIAVVALVGVTVFGTAIRDLFNSIADAL